MSERQRPAPDPNCRYCSGRGWVVGGDEVRDCYCRGLVATDLTEDTSALRGRRDALRHEAGELDAEELHPEAPWSGWK